MNDSIVVALLALLGTLAGSWAGVRQANKLVNFRIDKLEQKVEQHNSLIERIVIVERDIKTAFSKLDEIKDRR
ncbi:hypothetical protein LJC42_06340 [Eubacteriales bacterium OttesenSCG-928-K08]|nr:hypothetical protein [Eubacteriales bacterium OttesenSCG-928-K08]